MTIKKSFCWIFSAAAVDALHNLIAESTLANVVEHARPFIWTFRPRRGGSVCRRFFAFACVVLEESSIEMAFGFGRETWTTLTNHAEAATSSFRRLSFCRVFFFGVGARHKKLCKIRNLNLFMERNGYYFHIHLALVVFVITSGGLGGVLMTSPGGFSHELRRENFWISISNPTQRKPRVMRLSNWIYVIYGWTPLACGIRKARKKLVEEEENENWQKQTPNYNINLHSHGVIGDTKSLLEAVYHCVASDGVRRPITEPHFTFKVASLSIRHLSVLNVNTQLICASVLGSWRRGDQHGMVFTFLLSSFDETSAVNDSTHLHYKGEMTLDFIRSLIAAFRIYFSISSALWSLGERR